ncbi:MAG: SpoIIE family protein phosphatase, partial [Clostridia bacterium]|nr:SpoIIE family protein phosphatase [Clostridia bacterium]
QEQIKDGDRAVGKGRRLHTRFSDAFEGFGRSVGAMFTESICLRMATAGIAMLAVSLFRIIAGGFRYYDLFAALFSIAVAVAAVPVWSVCLQKKRDTQVLYALSAFSLMAALVWAGNFAVIGSIPVSAVLALVFTLWSVRREGVVFGTLTGFLCGAAYRPILLPSFLIAALIYAGIERQRGKAGVPLACLGALIWTVYADGAASFTVAFPAYLLAGAVFSLILLLQRRSDAPAADAETAASRDTETELQCVRSRHEETSDRFRSISDAFSSLSEIFYNLSDRLRRPGTLDLRRICDSSFDCFCTDCPNKTICWGLEYSETYNAVGGLISHLHTKGSVSSDLIPPHLRGRCVSMDRILEQINSECARFTGELLRSSRTEIFAMDYEAAANIINDALQENDCEYRFDPALETRMAEYLSDASITARGVSVYGMRRRQILVQGVNMDASTVTLETLRSDLGEMCGLELSIPVFEVENNVTKMTLQARRKLSVLGAQNNLSADGGVSGDTVNLFSNKKDYFYALISDGMGAGREAAFTSNLCSAFLEKMLRAGNRAVTSLRMLNNLILSRCSDSVGECSSTVDLIELDLITGKASFIKGGAAPSFVIRRGTVQRLQAGTFPIGIIRKLDTQASSYDLRAGDTVVMISDGILQDDPDCLWLTQYLGGCGDKDPEEIVYEICRHASEFPHHDDCSAIALRILNAEEIAV